MGSDTYWRRWINALLVILFFHGVCFSDKAPNYNFMHEATTAPLVSYYDYIVVGGGTAGCALAATLSAKATVLLLERGGSPYGNPNITNIDHWIDLVSNGSPRSPVQFFVSEDGVFNSRPNVLGGGTSINAGFYSRAEDSYVQDVGWDENLVNKSFHWVENKVVFKPQLNGWQSALKDGMLEAGLMPDNGFTYEHLIGTKVGGTIFDENSHRHTAADLLEHANSRRILVMLRATVHKILFNTKGNKMRPMARGVMFTDESGIEHRAYLKRRSKNEIIVSSGALGSPQLLMLSGVGPKEHLMSHNINVVVDQPLIGQGMKDSPMNNVYVPSPIPVNVTTIELAAITSSGSYIEGLSPTGNGPSPFKFGGFILRKAKGPESFGHLELRSTNVSDNPSVTFNYYKDPIDLQRCVEGVQIILKVIESQAFSKYRVSGLSGQDFLNITSKIPQNFPVHDNTTTSLEQFCRDTVKTIWHYHGGCQVGRVVDHDYKVLGVDALRVIDGSTFNSSPGTNPQATVMMLGRYMGVTILKNRSAKSDGLTTIMETNDFAY